MPKLRVHHCPTQTVCSLGWSQMRVLQGAVEPVAKLRAYHYTAQTKPDQQHKCKVESKGLRYGGLQDATELVAKLRAYHYTAHADYSVRCSQM